MHDRDEEGLVVTSPSFRFVSDFFQFFYEEIARRYGVQERQPLKTTEGDEVEIAFAVDTF